MDSKNNTIVFAFRRPRFPLLCDFGGDLFAATSAAALRRRLAGVELRCRFWFVDASGEGWIFLAEERIFAPGFAIRRWRKIEVIRMFNESRSAQSMGLQYPERRLANRRLDMLIRDIAAVLTARTTG